MKSCNRCGYLDSLEKHHKKHKIDGGSDANSNRVWLCRGCHDYQHAKDAVIKALKAEERRIAVLTKRLEIIERENTPKQIRERGYQAYFELFNKQLPKDNQCAQATK